MSKGSNALDYTIVVACYDEEDSIVEFVERLVGALETLTRRVDIVFVNDGSTDRTLEFLLAEERKHQQISAVVDLARNVGQTAALTAGIVEARGRDIVIMDCDLQIDPQDLAQLIEKFEEGYDVVGGYRLRRKDGIFRLRISQFGNFLASLAAGVKLRDIGSGFKVVRGDFLRAFGFGPNRLMNPGEIMLSIRSIAEIPIQHQPRRHGPTRWSTRKRLTFYYLLLRELVPLVFPFAIVFFFLGCTAILLYTGAAVLLPGRLWLPTSEAFGVFLSIVSISTTLLGFLVLGEITLVARAVSSAPGYVVRKTYRKQPE